MVAFLFPPIQSCECLTFFIVRCCSFVGCYSCEPWVGERPHSQGLPRKSLSYPLDDLFAVAVLQFEFPSIHKYRTRYQYLGTYIPFYYTFSHIFANTSPTETDYSQDLPSQDQDFYYVLACWISFISSQYDAIRTY